MVGPRNGPVHPAGVTFRRERGLPLDRHCAQCGAGAAPTARFCASCGRALESVVPPATNQPAMPVAFAAGRYTVKGFLGEGGKKRVYLAHDARLDRDVAVAVVKAEGLDETGLARVQREARAMGRLGDHPNIVTVHDVGEEAGQVYIVSQYIPGGSVEDLLRRTGKAHLPLDEVLRLADQVARALEHAHRRGIVHRDLKPSNVWLTEEGAAKLGDFGLALTLDRSRLTVEGMMVGTVTYMPPEQALGRETDARSDLYALGAMLYELVTNRPPFLGDDAVGIISQHINTPPVAPSWHNPDVPRALEALILRLLAKVPEDRPESATAVRLALSAIVAAPAPTNKTATRPEANPLDRLAGGVFVGREAEMEELRAGLEDALSGHGRLLLLTGEPGIGKTRAAEELATYARLRKAQVLWGRCYEGKGAPAYWPWVQAVRTYVHDREPQALLAEMGSGASDIAQMISEVREKLPGLPPPPALEPEQARFRLFDGFATFLKNAGKAQPLVVVLDDVHWADRSSLLLLQFVARELRDARLLVIGTYRDVEVGRQHPLAETMAELTRGQLSQRILLRGLGEHDVARFIEITAGIKPPASLVQAVHRETDGNPFFVNEVVRLLVAEGRLEHPGAVRSWSLDIPEGVKAVVGRRLDRLSAPCNQVLSIASVIGREFELAVLEGLTDVGGDRLLDLVEEAVAARVIAEVPTDVGRYAFSHALVRDTLSSELTPTRRARLHRRVGEVLETVYGARVDAHLAELAHHFLEAARGGGDVGKAIDYAARAGERATASLAYEEAVEQYERALQALELREPMDERRRCELLLALGEARHRAGQVGAAKDAFFTAADIAREIGCAELLARAALRSVGGWVGMVEVGQADPRMIELLEDALAALGDADSILRARLLGRLATELYFRAGTEDTRDALSRKAVEMARRLGDPTTLADTLRARHVAIWGPENAEERAAITAEVLGLGAEEEGREVTLMVRWWRLGDLLELGNIAALEQEFETYARDATARRFVLGPWTVPLHRAMRALREGRFEEVELLAQEALLAGQQVHPETASLAYTVQMATLFLEVGRVQELETSVRGFADQMLAVPGFRWGLLFLLVRTDRAAEAREAFERLAAADFGDLPRDGFWLADMMLVVETCIAVGDVRRAGILYELLLPFAERNLVHGFGVVCWGCAGRLLGLLATFLGRFDDAERHFEMAIRLDDERGARPFAARTRQEYAAMLLERDRPRDREKALDLLARALETAQEIGQTTVVERAIALKLRAQGIDNADLRVSLDAVVSLVETERPDLRSHSAPDGTVTILFTDIENSTAITEQLGDHRAQEVLRAHNSLVREHIRAHRGFEVKSLGDGFMVAFQSARQALACAIDLQRAFAACNPGTAEAPVRIRIGLHVGEAIREADDFFGKAVVLAARIAAQARGGEILASSLLKEITESVGEFCFEERRDLALRGLSGTYGVHPVTWQVAR